VGVFSEHSVGAYIQCMYS